MQRFVVPCECGEGVKLFLRAGEHAQNLSRFYYRCPSKIKSCSFVWADELLSNKYSHLHPLIVPCENYLLYQQSHGHRSRRGSFQPQRTEGISEEVSSREQLVVDIPQPQFGRDQASFINMICCYYGFACTMLCILLVFFVVMLLVK